MSLGNGYSNYTIEISDKKRYLFYQKYKPAFLTIIIISALTMFYFAYNVDIGILMLTILSTLLGTAYNISFEKNTRFNDSFIFKLFKKLVAFKAIVISVAVTTLLNGSIFLLNRNILKENTLSFIFSISIVFIFMFIRQALIEIKFSQSDKIAGATTLTTYIDSRKLAIITAIIPIIFLISVIIADMFLSNFNNIKYFIPIIYSSIISFIVMRKKIMTSRQLFSILIDSTLYILFLAALI